MNKHISSKEAQKAFTLMELAIVLVIIGLVIAGVTAGASIARAAGMRSVVSDINQYKVAVNSFKLQYKYYPGDTPNAVSYFGGTTVNGDGNGQIAWNTEGYRAWQHLMMANLIPGNYTGTATGNTAVIGENVPDASIKGSGYSFEYAASSASTTVDGGWFGNTIMYGAPATGTATTSPIITPKEAYNIDLKIDDGIPDAGKSVRARMDVSPACVTGSEYSISNTNNVCALQFVGL